ncbi:hypothetical protein D3C87_1988990 [compost metagenome]
MNTIGPTIGFAGGSGRPAAVLTNSASSLKWMVSSPVRPPYKCFQARATSSMEALPARSPIPVTVVLAHNAPASNAASVLAVAIPKSLWQ